MSRRTNLTAAGVATLAAVLVLATGCNVALNYTDPAGPRFAGALPGDPPTAVWRDTLGVVSFNIAFGRHMDSALVVLTAERDLAGADVILLQEVDEDGTRRLADALGMAFVYYPATLRERTDRNFGNAVLSRWPIVDDAKLLLPHIGAVGRSLRTATAATIQVGRTPIRVYSLHLAMPLNQALRDRQDQMLAILRDAAAYPRVIIGGDTNSPGMGHLAVERGYAWPTRHGPDTGFIGRLDHIFFKGLVPPPEAAAGTVRDNRGASDHLPVWARGVVY